MTSNRESPSPAVEVPRNFFKENAGRPLLAKSVKVIDAKETGSLAVNHGQATGNGDMMTVMAFFFSGY